jgi:hypothetical protein
VKKPYDVHLDDNQFDNEVTYLIIGAKHKNIVQLLGYCAESRKETVEAVCSFGWWLMVGVGLF